MQDYFHQAKEIYEYSVKRLYSKVDFSIFPQKNHIYVERMIHAVADEQLVDSIKFSDDFHEKIQEVLKHKCRIYCDSGMVAAGIISREYERLFAYHDPAVRALKHDIDRTQSAAQVDYWLSIDPHKLQKSVVVIGNAPTVLFRLIEWMERDPEIRPAALIAVPVGFVGASSAKAYLMDMINPPPFCTLLGNRGGSPIACGAMNAAIDGKSLVASL